MNRYLEKLAKETSEENKTVAKTFAIQTAVGVPSHLIGGAIGGKLGSKYLGGTASNIGSALNRTSGKLKSLGGVGTSLAKKLKVGKMSGGALGVGLGMAAVGGVGDLLALKHGFHGKIKEHE